MFNASGKNLFLLNSFDEYLPHRSISFILALIIYLLLVHWTIQLYIHRCFPRILGIFLLISHLGYFIELILRSTLDQDQIRQKWIYLVRFALINVPFRLILFGQFHFLIELRGKRQLQRFDRIIDLIVPIFATIADILFGISNEILFRSPSSSFSFFLLRFIGSMILILLSILFLFIWIFPRDRFDRQAIRIFLFVSNICLLIQSISMLIQSNSFVWILFQHHEFYFHLSHSFPLLICFILWNWFHPSRYFHLRSVQNNINLNTLKKDETLLSSTTI